MGNIKKGMISMKKLNIYDDVSVTSPRIRLEEVTTAKKVLRKDFKCAEELADTKCVKMGGLQNILEQRETALDNFKAELLEEIKVSHGGLLTFGKIVHFKDAQLERAIREELNIYDRPVTKIDMRRIKKLFVEGCYSIEGLQYADNIEELSLTWTDIFTDIESDRDTAIIFSIIRSTLKKLSISHSVIKKYTALSALYNLEKLSIISNYSDYLDFSFFGLLTKIDHLEISKKCISPKIEDFLNKNPELQKGITFV